MLITLPLYVLRELGKAMALALFVFLFVMLGVTAGTTLRDGVSLWTVVWTLPYMVPLVSPQVLPLAIITGILVCYGRLSSNNEFIAAQAGGVHPFWLGVPALVLATGAVFVTVFLNEFALGPSTRAINRAGLADQTNILRRRLARPGSITQDISGSRHIAVCILPTDPVDGGRPIEITEFVSGPAPSAPSPTDGVQAAEAEPLWDWSAPWPTRHIVARSHRLDGVVRGNDGVMRLQMYLERPVVYRYGRLSLVDTETFSTGSGEQSLPLGKGGRMSITGDRPKYWTIMRLQEERRAMEATLARYRAGMDNARQNAATEAERTKIQEDEEDMVEDIRQYTAQLNMKIALSFSCFAFAFLGAPMGLSLKRKATATGFVVGTVVAIVYFGFVKLFQQLTDSGAMPGWSLWLPNGVLILLSLWYWRKAIRTVN